MGEVYTEKAKELLGKGYVLLDVRTKEEYDFDKIQPSINMDVFDDFENKVDELDKKDKYLVLCRSGNRSRTACEIMKEKGFEAHNVEGGLLDW